MRTVSFDGRPPKLLPWLARQAGVDEDRALALWHQALDEIGEGDEVGPLERFRELLAREEMGQRGGLHPWFHLQDRLWRGGTLSLANAAVLQMGRTLRNWHGAYPLR